MIPGQSFKVMTPGQLFRVESTGAVAVIIKLIPKKDKVIVNWLRKSDGSAAGSGMRSEYSISTLEHMLADGRAWLDSPDTNPNPNTLFKLKCTMNR